MKSQTYNLHPAAKNLVAFDYSSEHDFIGLTKAKKLVTPYETFNIKNKFRFPIIRKLQNGCLIINMRSRNKDENCFIFDNQGILLNKFYVGDGVEDFIIQKGKIIVSYFDEGVLGAKGPNNNGISIFDINGKLLFGYNESKGGLTIMDCYCMNKFDNQKVAFFAYTKFNLILLDVDSYEEKAYQIPSELFGANALTCYKNKLYFHAPYNNKTIIYEWKLGNVKAIKVGEFKGRLIGLKDGKFLSYYDKSYTIIDMTQP